MVSAERSITEVGEQKIKTEIVEMISKIRDLNALKKIHAFVSYLYVYKSQ